MDFREKLTEELKQAMKAKDQVRLTTVRGLKARLMEREIEKGSALNEAEFIKLVQSAVKQRRDSIAQYERAERKDLVDNESAELRVLEKYLPDMLTEEETHAMVQRIIAETGASSMRDMGVVMKELMAASQGRADGKLLQRFVRETLG